MAKTVRLEEGVAVEYGDHGRIRSVGRDFVSVATDGQGTIAGVTKSGVVLVYRDGAQQFQRSNNAVSVQMSGDHIFVLQDDGVTVEYDSRGTPIRNIGIAKQKQQTKSSEESYSYDNSGDVPDGFMAGMMCRCKEVINTPIDGPWAKICVWLMAIAGVVIGAALHVNVSANLESWEQFVLVVGSAVAIGGLGYWLRHALAKCLVRSWYGAPAVLLASVIYSVDPTIGMWALAAAFLLWFWPIWPIMIIVIAVALLILVALGKCAKTKD